MNISVLLKAEDAERARGLKKKQGGTAPMVRKALVALEDKDNQGMG